MLCFEFICITDIQVLSKKKKKIIITVQLKCEHNETNKYMAYPSILLVKSSLTVSLAIWQFELWFNFFIVFCGTSTFSVTKFHD